MEHQAKEPPLPAAEGVHVSVSGGAVGHIGVGGTVNMVTPRREIEWPVVVGSPPPLASAFRSRSSVLGKMEGQAGERTKQVLSGDRGVGKSQVAAGVFAASDADLRAWVAAGSRTAVISGFAKAAVKLDLADSNIDPVRLAELFLEFLAATDKRWLVVLDDVADPTDMTSLWPTGCGQLVVTTTRQQASLSGGGRTLIRVDVYTQEEAHGYLIDRLTPYQEFLPSEVLGEVDELTEDLGWLPLGLAQAAAVIIDQAISCRQYRQWFADRTRALEELFPPEADTDGYGKTVATTWQLAIEAADHLEPAGLARPTAALVALCDPVGAPEAVFVSGAACRWFAEATGRPEVDEDLARKALRVLAKLSLISHEPNSGPRAVRMHHLTGRAVLHRLPADSSALALAAADSLLEVWPEFEDSPLLSEALRASTAAVDRASQGSLLEARAGCHPVLFRAGRSLLELGLVRAAIKYHEQLLDRTANILGPDHPDTLLSQNNLAWAYQSAGRLDRAIPLFKKTLKGRQSQLGPDHLDTLISQNNLAWAYESAGKLDRAIPLFEETLNRRQRLLGADHPETNASGNNLAWAYQSAGNLDRAIPLFEETLDRRQRLLGAQHPDTLASRNNLAWAYQSAGDLDRAIPLFEATLRGRQRRLGAEHPDTLASGNNLAWAYQSAGDLDRAIPLFEATLRERQRLLGAEHPDTQASRSNLAWAYQSAGNLDRAIPLYEQTLRDRERTFGPEHPSTVASRDQVAKAYQLAGRPVTSD